MTCRHTDSYFECEYVTQQCHTAEHCNYEHSVVSLSDAQIQPYTMVIESVHTCPALVAVFGSAQHLQLAVCTEKVSFLARTDCRRKS